MNLSKKKKNLLFQQNGACQADRLPKHLLHNETLIEDSTLDDYLVFAYLYSDVVQYHNTKNIPSAHNVWRKFLEKDDTVLLSLIRHTNLVKLRSMINSDLLVLRKSLEKKESKYIAHLLQALTELTILLTYWYDHLSAKNSVRLEIQSITNKKLNPPLSLLYQLLQQWEFQKDTVHNFCTFWEETVEASSLWQMVDQHYSLLSYVYSATYCRG